MRNKFKYYSINYSGNTVLVAHNIFVAYSVVHHLILIAGNISGAIKLMTYAAHTEATSYTDTVAGAYIIMCFKLYQCARCTRRHSWRNTRENGTFFFFFASSLSTWLISTKQYGIGIRKNNSTPRETAKVKTSTPRSSAGPFRRRGHVYVYR